MATLTGSWSLPITVPLSVALACGAGAVIVTAAALSGRAARNPDMPAQRWSRPLPATFGRVIAARSTRAVLPVLGLIATAAGCVALVSRATPVNGLAALAALTWVALTAGPIYRLVNPVRAVTAAPPSVLADSTAPVDRHAAAAAQAQASDPHHATGEANNDREGTALADHARRHRHGDHRHGDHHDDPHTTATAPLADATTAVTAFAAELRYASAWLFALCAILLSTQDPQVLTVTVALHVVAQSGLARWRPGTLDPLEVLSDLVARIAPLGRDLEGRLAWRNPLVAVTHTNVPRGAVTLGAVVIAASMTGAMTGRGAAGIDVAALGTVAPVIVLAGTLAIVLAVLHLGVIRPFFASATVPLVVAYATVAAGRWWPPVDLITFVVLHTVAIAVLHRQAIARHDLRTARAVQLPMRVVVMLSVLTGLTLLWAS